MIGFGQGWEKTYGGGNTDYGYSVQQTTDGGYIITGTGLFGNIDDDIYLIKTNSIGDSLWAKTFGGTNIDIGYSVHQTTDGGYIITGIKNWNLLSPSLDSSNVWLIKTDGNGNEQWTKTFGGTNHDEGRSVQQTTDGGYIICGRTASFGNGSDVYLIKTDGNGIQQWYQTFSGTSDDLGYSVQQTTDGGYIICGSTWSSSVGWDVWLIKTDVSGNQQWNQINGGTNDDVGESIKQTTDGGYIICGSTYSFSNPVGYIIRSDIYLIKTDSQGDSLWTRTFGGNGHDFGHSVQQTTDDGYIICGSTSSFGNVFDVYLIKTDINWVEQWNQTFGGNGDNFGFSVQQTTDDGFIITGSYQNSLGTERKVYLIKTDSQGNITSTFNIPIPSSTRKLEKVIDILGKQTKPKTNTPFIEIYDDGTVEKKIIIE